MAKVPFGELIDRYSDRALELVIAMQGTGADGREKRRAAAAELATEINADVNLPVLGEKAEQALFEFLCLALIQTAYKLARERGLLR